MHHIEESTIKKLRFLILRYFFLEYTLQTSGTISSNSTNIVIFGVSSFLLDHKNPQQNKNQVLNFNKLNYNYLDIKISASLIYQVIVNEENVALLEGELVGVRHLGVG